MARSLVKSMLREGNFDYAEKIMKSVFIANLFTQEDGAVFKEELVSSLLSAVGDERPSATSADRHRWMKVSLNVLFSTCDCLTWPTESGTAVDRYLNALFTVGSFITDDQNKETTVAVDITPVTPTTPEREEEEEMEEEGEPAMLIFQRVLKHNVLKVLPEVTDASVRLQTIWVLAQFVVNGDLQKVLLGLVLQRLRQTTTEEMIHDDRFAAFQHVGSDDGDGDIFLLSRPPWLWLVRLSQKRRLPRATTWFCPISFCVVSSTLSVITRSWL